MECVLLCVGKTDQAELKQLIDLYQNRLKHYTKFSLVIIDDIKNSKNLSEKQQKEAEGKALEKQLKASDRIVLLAIGGNSLIFLSWGINDLIVVHMQHLFVWDLCRSILKL